MTTEFVKDNDYTISVITKTEHKAHSYYSPTYKEHTLTRTFNFLSAQVTTLLHDSIHQPAESSSVGSSAAVSTQLFVQNFSDIQSAGEIKLMHTKLLEMGGQPPALEDLLPMIDKKPSVLRH